MLIGITGGTGFIGALLVRRHLARGDRIRILSRQSRLRSALPDAVEITPGDLISSDAGLTSFTRGVDVLYHCAGELRDESRMRALHVDGTRALLSAARGKIGRWVQLSSVGVYGPKKAGVVREDTALNPLGTYETTKAESDALVIAAGSSGRLGSYSILRPSIVFGAGMPNQSVSQMIRMIEGGFFFFIGRPGSSANYVEVSNVVGALMLCGTRPEADGRVYVLSDWCTMEEFVGAICKAVGRSIPRVRVPEWPVRVLARALGRAPRVPLTESRVDALVNRARYATDRIQAELGYTHSISIADGLSRFVAGREAR
jgi:nucleoside-diphosphate-sugar epimerase